MITRIFDSLEEFMRVEEHQKNKNHIAVRQKYSGMGDWLGRGVKTIQDVDKIIRNGWPEGVREAMDIKERIERVLISPKVLRKRKSRGDFGDEIDIQRVYAGDLERAWTRSTREMVVGVPVIRILTGMGGESNKSPRDFFYKGVGVAILTDILEEQGYRVEIVAYDHGARAYTDTQNTYYFEVPIKESREPLDLARLVTTTALAGFYRYYGFKAILSVNHTGSWSMGRVIEAPPEGYAKAGDIILNNIYSEDRVISVVERELGKLGLGEGR